MPLAPKPTVIQPPVMTEQQVIARLEDWRERLLERKAGTTNCVLTLREIREQIDRHLDELSLWMRYR